eukprot:m.115770 g.115770  ORF g.115770 m.115770 type:complete len:76 (+) comp13580_c0_seq1:537-764(+)
MDLCSRLWCILFSLVMKRLVAPSFLVYLQAYQEQLSDKSVSGGTDCSRRAPSKPMAHLSRSTAQVLDAKHSVVSS